MKNSEISFQNTLNILYVLQVMNNIDLSIPFYCYVALILYHRNQWTPDASACMWTNEACEF